MEALPDARDVLDPQPMQLDVLAGGQIGIAIAEDGAVDGTLRERVGGHADLAELRSGELAAGGLDAQHERIAALALRVEAHPLEPLHLAGHRGDRCRPLLRVPVDDRLGDLEGWRSSFHFSCSFSSPRWRYGWTNRKERSRPRNSIP